jgi:hypothetical protein
MSDKVGGYTGIKPGGMRALVKGTKPGGARLYSNKVGGYRIDPGTGGL